MTVVAWMQLVEAGPVKCLAGHASGGDSVFILRKQTADAYELHEVPISNAEQSLRSILAADQSEQGELIKAVLQTASKPPRKPRKASKRKAKKEACPTAKRSGKRKRKAR